MQKYKGVWLSITVLTRALAGSYCNFGVFDLYGDPALKVRCRQLQLACTGLCLCGALQCATSDCPTVGCKLKCR